MLDIPADLAFMHACMQAKHPSCTQAQPLSNVDLATPPTMTKHHDAYDPKPVFPRKGKLRMHGVRSKQAPWQLGGKLSEAGWHTTLTAIAQQMLPSAYDAKAYTDSSTQGIFPTQAIFTNP